MQLIKLELEIVWSALLAHHWRPYFLLVSANLVVLICEIKCISLVIDNLYKDESQAIFNCFRQGRHVRWGGPVLQFEMEQPSGQSRLSLHRPLPGMCAFCHFSFANLCKSLNTPQAESLVDVSLAAEGKHLQAHKVLIL